MPWTPLRLIPPTHLKPPAEELLAEIQQQLGQSREEALATIEAENTGTRLYMNDIYQVQVRPTDDPNFVWINIRRRDGKAIFRDWRHFQQIKNEVLGPDCEAIELYPAERRKVDTSNKYHLFGCTKPDYEFPIGWGEGAVSYDQFDSPGMKQRPRTVG